ncbi:MAG: hypothetical protein GKS05_04725 [Nitrospirales bacterium]|nr:hypothetical protein [Nitrospirales bacterium]
MNRSTPLCSGRIWASSLATFLSVGLWIVSAFGATQEIAIFKSADLKAYNQAVTAAKSAFGPAFTFLEMNLKGNLERGRKLARKLRASDVELVLAIGLKAALAAKLEILDVPVVYTMVLDPARYNLIAPNITGVLLDVPIERQLASISEVLPYATRIGVLYDPNKTARLLAEARHHATAFGMKIISREIQTEKDVPEAARSLLTHVHALWLLPDSTVLNEDSLRFLLDTTLEVNIPLIGFSTELVRSGALLSLSVDYKEVGAQAAQLSKTILSGKVSVPYQVISPSQVKMALNLKTAKFLGLTLDPKIIERAHERY